eukprot:CAMPEP_0116067738 /NCGR_PEP_ID=MMETSP0322-20121206/11230_1 /TAXON_ID=163516 /ORGANISM="Leptocylindrus danicus var. apora, Strain B651" /LENGTH=332 /DNA_ID=CAMNT_0003554687 /DNA_START=21 /DNA_END=1019 /DNA_ORIENTATION=+
MYDASGPISSKLKGKVVTKSAYNSGNGRLSSNSSKERLKIFFGFVGIFLLFLLFSNSNIGDDYDDASGVGLRTRPTYSTLVKETTPQTQYNGYNSNINAQEGSDSYDQDEYGSNDRDEYGSNDKDEYVSNDRDEYGSNDQDEYGSNDQDEYGSNDEDEYGGNDEDEYGSNDQDEYGSNDQVGLTNDENSGTTDIFDGSKSLSWVEEIEELLEAAEEEVDREISLGIEIEAHGLREILDSNDIRLTDSEYEALLSDIFERVRDIVFGEDIEEDVETNLDNAQSEDVDEDDEEEKIGNLKEDIISAEEDIGEVVHQVIVSTLMEKYNINIGDEF